MASIKQNISDEFGPIGTQSGESNPRFWPRKMRKLVKSFSVGDKKY